VIRGLIRYLILGIIQGLTEFLPVSSSGHLVIAEEILHFDPPGTLLEAGLHLGTLCAVLFIFRRDIFRLSCSLFLREGRQGRQYLGLLLVATIPIVIFGLAIQGPVEAAFTSILLVGVCLLVTGGALFFADVAARRARYSKVRPVPALVIGLAQAAALLPGISRSGATIATGLFFGIQGGPAARFSFLLSIPAILGAAGLKFYQVVVDGAAGGTDWGGLLVGVLAAGIVGALAIKGLLAIIAKGRLRIFGFYCLIIGLSTIFYSLIT